MYERKSSHDTTQSTIVQLTTNRVKVQDQLKENKLNKTILKCYGKKVKKLC